MKIDAQDECIYEINDILSILSKGDKWIGIGKKTY